jgi:hypothetical protein
MNTKKPNKKLITKPFTDDEAIKQYQLMHRLVEEFNGSANELESALGVLFIGRYFGWKILHMMHSKQTIKKYESILGISIRDEFPEYGEDAKRSLVYDYVTKLSNFWKTVSGKSEVEGRRIITAKE